MKVLLANPPWLRPGWHGVRAGSRWPHMERAESPYSPFPFLMGYAAAVLEQDGVEVEVIDACAERLDLAAFCERFDAAAPDLVVAEISTPSLGEDLATVRAMRARGFDGPLLLAGLHKAMYEPAFLEQHPDVTGALVGEYELTLRDLVRAGGRVIEPLPGLIARGSDGELLDGGRKPSIAELDALPWPARHLFCMDRYHDLPGGIPAPSVQMWGSRGCSFTCSFCAWPQILYGDNRYRVRDPHAIVDEAEAMVEQGYASLYFDDDTFNLGKKRTAAISDTFTERGLDVPWAFMGRADTCDPAQYEALARTGLKAVKFGVESADIARLKQIGKNLDVARVREAVAAVKALDIATHLTFVFGLPGETLDSMQRTLDLAYELDPDSAQFTIAVPFPGSRLHSELAEAGRLADDVDFSQLDGYRTGVVSTDALQPEQIVAFVHGVHRRWERRPRPAGPAPRIPVAEVGGSAVSVGLLVRPGEGEWLRLALAAVAGQEGPPREVVVVADSSDPSLPAIAAEAHDGATFLDAAPGESAAAMANRVPEACTGGWIALLQQGVVPRNGWLEAAIAAGRAHPDVGGLAMTVHRPDRDPCVAGLSASRWGRVLPSWGAPGDPVLAASSKAGLFARAMLEDVGGFDGELPGELADVDLALRALLLGWPCVAAHGPVLDGPPELTFIDEDRDDGLDRAATRRWAAGRLRLLLKSLPREAWQETGPAIALELIADVYRAARHGRHPGSIALGLASGLLHRGEALAERPRALGRRRVGERYVREAFAAAERDMAHCRWQRLLQAVFR
jgi:radical SAM superfamily enzyme YgiQ (UPF0313 family)